MHQSLSHIKLRTHRHPSDRSGSRAGKADIGNVRKVASFAAEYDLTMQYEGLGLHSIGRLYYSGTSRYRVEGMTNGHRIITVSRNEVSQTYFVDLKLLSQSNTIENQSPMDLLHGLSDIRDPFSVYRRGNPHLRRRDNCRRPQIISFQRRVQNGEHFGHRKS